jgi:peptidyl-prolyl cis-trans isomerase-like 4
MIQTGDPTATGKGGTSVYGLMYGEQARFFEDEVHPLRKHNEKGLLCMANMGVPNSNGSQFFVTMRGDDLQHLDGKHTIFGRVEEDLDDVLDNINTQLCDEVGRPFRDIRILHTHVLDDPYDDPPQLDVPPESPVRDRPVEEKVPLRLGATEDLNPEGGKTTEELEKVTSMDRATLVFIHIVLLELANTTRIDHFAAL